MASCQRCSVYASAIKDKDDSHVFGAEMSGLDTDGEGWADDEDEDHDLAVRTFMELRSQP